MKKFQDRPLSSMLPMKLQFRFIVHEIVNVDFSETGIRQQHGYRWCSLPALVFRDAVVMRLKG
jgi:hypothetical protein